MTRSISFSRTHDGVELGLSGERGEVAAELVEDERSGRSFARRLALALLALVALHELEDGLADLLHVQADLHQHLRGHTLALAQEAEQDVLGSDVVVAELERLAQRQLEDLLCARSERDVALRRGRADADHVLDLGTDLVERDAQRLQRLRSQTLALVDEAEEQVLRADVVVVEEACFLLRQDDDSACPVGEPFEHLPSLLQGLNPLVNPLSRARCAEYTGAFRPALLPLTTQNARSFYVPSWSSSFWGRNAGNRINLPDASEPP